MNIRKLEWLKRTLGPGILFASTAIGVSHLVQSTRAGANYGFGLLFFIIIANIFKYPFFEFGSRYAISTSTSIISGYKRLGNWVLWSYFILTLFSMLFLKIGNILGVIGLRPAHGLISFVLISGNI